MNVQHITKPRVVYFANHRNYRSDDTEGHITHGMQKLGYEVLCIRESDMNHVPLNNADVFLFHKGGPNIHRLLDIIPYKKVCWYFDKVWNERETWMNDVLPKVDVMAMTDEAWARKHPNKKICIVHQGIGDRDNSTGNVHPRYDSKIAFTGSIYGERRRWLDQMEKRYGKDFKRYGSIFNRDLYDLCASTPIIVAPRYPTEDYYWSSRIYMILGSGGFLIHPLVAGIEKEYTSGEHFVGYHTDEEMHKAILHYLNNPEEREKIQLAGYEKTISKFTYTKRIELVLRHALGTSSKTQDR